MLLDELKEPNLSQNDRELKENQLKKLQYKFE